MPLYVPRSGHTHTLPPLMPDSFPAGGACATGKGRLARGGRRRPSSPPNKVRSPERTPEPPPPPPSPL